MRAPTACRLWRDPEPAARAPLQENFELLDTFVDDNHWTRYLLRCRECGQRYVYEFYEEIDWADGEDPQYCTWIPVETAAEIQAVTATGPGELAGFRPCLRKDWPKGATAPSVYWFA